MYIYNIDNLLCQVTDLRIYNTLPTQDRLATEIEVEIAIATAIGTEIGPEVVTGTRGVPATSISRTSGVSGATGAVRRMEGIIIGIPTPNAIGQLVPEMIAGRSRRETIAGQRAGMTEWAAVVDGATIEAVEEEAKSTGRSPLPETSDWRWSCLALEILGSILANTRISQLRLPETTYRHTSHL